MNHQQLTPTQLYRLYVVTAACSQCKAPRGEYCKGRLGKPMKSGGHISRVGVARAIFKSRPELRAKLGAQILNGPSWGHQ